MITYVGITIFGILIIFCSFILLGRGLKAVLTLSSKSLQRAIYVIVALIFLVAVGGGAIIFARFLKTESVLSETYFLVAYILAFFFCAHRFEKIITEDMKKIWK